MSYNATKEKVSNRGAPPDDFLDELVGWGKQAADELFAPDAAYDSHDIYSSVDGELGPWQGVPHRRAVMLEVMRVLAGFESSWNWNAGRDTNNPKSDTPETIEAGAWQVSANSMNVGQDLKDLVRAKVGTLEGNAFQMAMKENHLLAMEFVARLLRHTTKHNGPVRDHKIHRWLSRDAAAEFQALVRGEPKSEKIETVLPARAGRARRSRPAKAARPKVTKEAKTRRSVRVKPATNRSAADRRG